MASAREIMAIAIGGAMLIGGGVYLYRFYRADIAPRQQTAESAGGTLVIPAVAEMCRSRGATEGEALKQCEADENAAGEFVIAWMGYNNFIVEGAISLDQIQAIASLDDASPLGDLSADPSLGNDLGGDPLGQGDVSSGITSGTDSLTGTPSGFLQSPAQLALYCLQMSGDWITMSDCISTNDPSSSISGTQ
jgi:hypothetical protein